MTESNAPDRMPPQAPEPAFERTEAAPPAVIHNRDEAPRDRGPLHLGGLRPEVESADRALIREHSPAPPERGESRP